MSQPPNALHSPARLRALEALQIFRTAPEPGFTRAAELAASIFDMPIAVISFVAAENQWRKAAVGAEPGLASNAGSFCAAIVEAGRPLQNAEMPFRPDAARPPGRRPAMPGFRAGAPLTTAEGFHIGCLAIADTKPRTKLSRAQLNQLEDLAALVMEQVQLRAPRPQLVSPAAGGATALAALVRRSGPGPAPAETLPGSNHEQVAAELQGSYLLLDAVVEGSADAIFVKDRNGVIVFTNSAAANLAGLKPVDLIGFHDADFLPAAVAQRFREQDLAVMASGTPMVFENCVEFGGQVQYQMTTLSPWRSSTGEILGTFGVARDITQIKHHEAALRTAIREAESANRAKSAFLANMSHELRTPLNAIIGFAQMLENEIFGPVGSAKNAEYVRDIARGGHQLLELITDILDLSRIEAGRLDLQDEPIALDQAFEEQQMLFAARAQEAGLTLIVDPVPPTLPLLTADRRALRTMLSNLLGNAVKFTPPGGTVRLSALREQDGAVTLGVSDTGPGILAEDLPRMCQPFQRGRGPFVRDKSGAGLGLSIVDGLVSAHRAALWIDTTPGEGTTVTLAFPADRSIERVPQTQAP